MTADGTSVAAGVQGVLDLDARAGDAPNPQPSCPGLTGASPHTPKLGIGPDAPVKPGHDGQGRGELPPGWAWARLEELCTITGGITVDAKRTGPDLVEVPYLRVANVQRGRLDLRTVKTIRVPGSRLEQLRLQPGDVLLNEGGDRDKVGRGWVWEGQIEDCVFQNHVFRARPRGPDVNPYFLSHYLNEAARAYFLAGAKQTTNLASISLSKVAATPVAVPPAAAQARIVAAVEALFADLDEAEAALLRAREGLAEYRASLLHAACTGALTAAWRDANPIPAEDGNALLRRTLEERRAAWERSSLARSSHRAQARPSIGAAAGRYKQPSGPSMTGPAPLPHGWTWATVEQLGFVSGGLTKNASRKGEELRRPYLRVANVGEARFDLTDLRTIGVTVTELDRVLLRSGDVLFVEGNGSPDQIGRVALWDGTVEGCVHQNHLIKLRPVQKSLGPWTLAWFMSPLGKRCVQDAASSTSGLHTLSISKIAALPVPLPPIAEVEEVATHLPGLLEEEVTSRAELDALGAEAATLRQSILHTAFTGRLVPQDPGDGPAATLLQRLQRLPLPLAGAGRGEGQHRTGTSAA